MRLLIVDDDVPTVETVWDSIVWSGIGIHEVEIAYSVAQAKAVVERKPVDIIISDIEMPQDSGLDLLAWIRQRGEETEFILLTCHERFDYAAHAIKLDAAEYLVKPFDPKIMEVSLKRVVAKITEAQRLREKSEYGEWHSKNLRQEQLYFWLSLYSGIVGSSREAIQKEIASRKLPIDPSQQFRLILTKVTDYDRPLEDIGNELFFYLIENLHSRHICDLEENECVVRRIGDTGLWFMTTVPDLAAEELIARCERVTAACSESARIKATCCIGAACTMEELPEKHRQLHRMIQRSAAFYGQVFTENGALGTVCGEAVTLDLDRLERWLADRDKMAVLTYLRDVLKINTDNHTLDERSLFLMKQEILQVVFGYLSESGIQAAQLFHDENSMRLSDLATQSAVDMIRWANYLLERAYDYEEEVRKASGLIERINAYVHEHYSEQLDRNEIASAFHLAPEYLAKLYKKKTGVYLKDYIREYRVEQAKRLLRDRNVLVSDVAGAVGFDNFSYFSTIFRKYVGMAPNEYRRGE
jgi:two-component system, response regulator YesN